MRLVPSLRGSYHKQNDGTSFQVIAWVFEGLLKKRHAPASGFWNRSCRACILHEFNDLHSKWTLFTRKIDVSTPGCFVQSTSR